LVVLLLAAVVPMSAHASFPGANGKIAFGRDGCIYSMNPDGTGEALAAPCPESDFGGSRWAADGRRLAYINVFSGEVLYVTDGQFPTLVYFASDPGGVGWSPDGQRLVLSDHGVSQSGETTELWTQTLAGGQHTTLQSNTGIYFVGEWSPDGTKIGFTTNGSIYTIKPDGSALTPIAAGGFGSWSPDGTKIAFTRSNHIWSMNADGTGQVQLTSGSSSELNPAWSPDGTKIAFSRGDDIWVMNAGGGAEQNLTNSPSASEGSPSWQPLPINSFPRPKGATPILTALTVAYRPCTSSNRTHGPPLAAGSCNPPVQTSDYLTVGTLDANGQKAGATAWVRADVAVGSPSTPEDDADVRLSLSISDVRNKDLADYPGELSFQTSRRITDKDNAQPRGGAITFVAGSSPISVATTGAHLLRTGDRVSISGVSGALCANGTWTITVTSNSSFTLDGSSGCGNGSGGTWEQADPPRGAATVQDLPFSATIPCATTPDTTIGSLCTLETTADTLVPGSVKEGLRSIWELSQVLVYDGGTDGDADTALDNTLFMDEGIFVP
jgi:TolB protein